MNIALFGRSFRAELKEVFVKMIAKLENENVQISVYEPYYKLLKTKVRFSKAVRLFNFHHEIVDEVDCVFSIGGDGTMLGTLQLVRDSGIPVLGVNMGRLGFLSNIPNNAIEDAIDEVLSSKVKYDKRSVLHINTQNNFFGNLPYALNEVTIHKKDSSSMVIVNVWVDGQFLNAYWGDGLIIASPTGSTAYSLSCGGPILTPESQNFIITPIATHNLTVRPIVLSDKSVLKLKVEGREDNFLLTMDSRSETILSSLELEICKAPFSMNFVQTSKDNFFNTIREKLSWGLDIRN